MKRFLANGTVSMAIDLKDRFGNEIMSAISVKCNVLDRTGAIIFKDLPTSFTAGEKSLTVTIPGTTNTLKENTHRDVRKVEVQCFLENEESTTISSSYIIEASDLLIVGVNSFVTLEEAELISLDMPNLGDWDLINDDEKTIALIDSKNRLCRLTYSLLDISRPQESVSYVPEGIVGVSAGTSPWNIKNQLGDLTVEQYQMLPEKFKQALRCAQVADSADTLTPDKVAQKRSQGLILDTIGETKQMFSSSRPIDSQVSKRAMGYLSEFVIGSTLKIGRS